MLGRTAGTGEGSAAQGTGFRAVKVLVRVLVCVCPHFLGSTPKASLPAPTPILEAPVAVCMSVTVVQNKFYLSLLYPDLGLALCEPCPD
uniref:Uncharacterized protein n=1 Tax=Prolemur simus TaxID=1328070 RepID=A0A8C8ZAH3_PROSS